VVPGVAVIIVHQTLLMGIGLILAERRRRGAAYASGGELLGSALAFGGLGTLTALFYSGFVFWFQDYPRGGHLAVVLCATLLFVAATVAFALLLGSLFDRGERPAQALAASSALLFFLSGMPWPFSAMPQPLAWLAQLLPSTAGVQVLVKANQMQASMADVAPELATLALLTLGYGALAAHRLLRRRQREVDAVRTFQALRQGSRNPWVGLR
jgi:ABC-2 type transport system permease protein